MSTAHESSVFTRRMTGRVVMVDPANRQVRVTDGEREVNVLVPPGCVIRLNAEPIRLRLLEPGDPIEADVIESAAGCVAAAVRTGRESR
jgi:hypothetical protein